MEEETRDKKRKAIDAFVDVSRFDNFALEGDVDFLLDGGEIRVRVKSAIMKNASPVFAAMLGPNFKEGRALRAGGGTPVEIPLPEDDGVAFGWVCRVLHCQSDTDAWLPKTKEILQVLDVAEKYDLCKGIVLSVRDWIDKDLGHAEFSNLWSLLLACYRARDGVLFRAITRRLLLKYEGSFVDLAARAEGMLVDADAGRTTYRLAALLEESRNETVSKIFNVLHVGLPDALAQFPCRRSKGSRGQCIDSLGDQSVFHLQHDTNHSINKAAEHVKVTLNRLCAIGCCEGCARYRMITCVNLHLNCSNIEEGVRGLCRACSEQTSPGKCTHIAGSTE